MKENELYTLRKFRKALAKNNANYIYGLHKYLRVKCSLKVLEQDLSSFSMGKNYDYLLGTIPWLYDIKSFPEENRKESYLRIQNLRYKIKTYLLEQKQSKENKMIEKILNKLLGKLEVLSLAIYKTQEKEELEVLEYFVFEIKNLNYVRDIIRNNPHQINCLDKNSLEFIQKIVKNYIISLKKHVSATPLNHFADLLYYDRVLAIIVEREKEHFTMKELRILYDMFSSASKDNIYREKAKDRYAYFTSKWVSTFQTFMIEKIQKKSFSYKSKVSLEDLFYQYDIDEKFSLGTKEEAQTIYLNKLLNPLKPSEKYVYTVDSEGAKELDDGFSLEKDGDIYTLGIHVSNPIYDVKENSKILEEILRRVFSNYLYEKTIPLYPEVLGEDLFSLKEKTTRNVLSLYSKIDIANKKIISQECRIENVFIKKNDTYENCNKTMFEEENSLYKETLIGIKEILPLLSNFYKLDCMYSLVARKEPNITHTNITGSTTSEKMIESFMIFFNSTIASLARNNSIPFIYRNHVLDPLYKKDCEYYLERLKKENCTGFYTEELNMLKFMYPKSYYDTFSKGHAGLGVKNYCHISSAARRAGDNLNLIMLEKYYFQKTNPKEKKKDFKKLKKYAEFFNEQQQNMKGFTSEYYTLLRRK